MKKNSRYITGLIGLLLFASSLRVANSQVVKSQQQHLDKYSANCLAKSPKYDGECTRVSLSSGTDSTNIHFYNNEKRILTFIINNEAFGLESDAHVRRSKFHAIWDQEEQVKRIGGICEESRNGIECSTDNQLYMASIWN